ncbi:MAG TPA: p-hydroxycinnamoyl CoA hydratase/lyase [Methyloceanibacter sp.]|nr:p-hydroxycinnamoyl CoA hydratase/lyase [Methyloceanibacter sp.]
MEKKYETIEVSTANGITTVRFNRPEKRNAMNPTLHREMLDALSIAEFDADTQVLVITGNGDSFCAGQDLKEYFHEMQDDSAARAEIREISHAWRYRKLYHFPKPTIAAVNGWCFGGAFTVVASCDVAVVATEAVLGLSEVNFGHIAGGLVTKMVADYMLPRKALYFLMSGEQFDGRTAADVGFVTEHVARERLMERVVEIAESFRNKDQAALRACKHAFKAVDIKSMSHEDAYAWTNARTGQLQAEQKEHYLGGVGAFMDKEFRPGLESMPKRGSGADA